MQRFTIWILIFALASLPVFGFGDDIAIPAVAPILATIETTLKTSAGQIRQFAFDGQAETFFASADKPGPQDHFTLVFDQPIEAKSISVTTGQGGEQDQLDHGSLQISVDGKTFESLVDFSDGNASAGALGKRIQAIRVQLTKEHEHGLAIREFTVETESPLTHFLYPIEFTIDVTGAPEMKEWTEKVARICERAYPLINSELKSEGFIPARQISLTMKRDYDGVAFASGNRITGSVKFFQDHPDDVGAIVHETAHVVQNYRSRGNPGWLVEGVADYVRFFKFEPEKKRRLDPNRAHYNGSYHTTASFLVFVTEKYDKQAVLKINQQMREGKYSAAIFEQLTGKTLQELDDEWRASLK